VSVKITLDAMPFTAAPPVPIVFEEPPPRPHPSVRETPPESPVRQHTIATSPPANPDQPPAQTFLPYTPSVGPPEITSPRWLRRPHDLAAYYPFRAIGREIEGEVLLDCRVLTTGDLNCAIASETPENWGFGRAALRIAHDHRMSRRCGMGFLLRGATGCGFRSSSGDQKRSKLTAFWP